MIEGKTTPQRQVFGIATKVGKGYVAAGGEGVRRNGVERESGGRIFRQRLAEAESQPGRRVDAPSPYHLGEKRDLLSPHCDVRSTGHAVHYHFELQLGRDEDSPITFQPKPRKSPNEVK